MAASRPDTSKFYLLKSSGSVYSVKGSDNLVKLQSKITIKRISFAAQPRDVLFAISSDLKAYVWITEPDVPIRKTIEIYENERWTPTRGYSSSLLPTDRYHWSDESGRIERGKDDSQLPSANWWSWETAKWEIEENFAGVLLGPEGWTYAVDFPSIYYPEKRWNHMVRRRRWIRTARYRGTNRWVPLDGSDTHAALIDISVGGCDVSYNNATCLLSLWVVTADGQVLHRNNCNLLSAFCGNGWRTVELPDGIEAAQISCGPGEYVWLITETGWAMTRLGISRDCPQGTAWSLVEPPSSDCLLGQIAVGPENIWACGNDGSVWFRQGVKCSVLSGTSWVRIDHFSASSLTISRNGQVFALSANDKQIYWRTGVSVEDPHGKRWKLIVLKDGISDEEDHLRQDPWTMINATAGFLDPKLSMWDDGDEWRAQISIQLDQRFQKEMNPFVERFERAVDRVELESVGILKVWSKKLLCWEECKIIIRSSAQDHTDSSVSVEGKSIKITIPVVDVTGILMHHETIGEQELRLFTAFLTRAQSPLRMTGPKAELDHWNNFLMDVYWNYLEIKDLSKTDTIWILAPSTDCPLISQASVAQISSIKWVTLGGHFRTIEAASGLTWALGMDRSVWIWTGSYPNKSGTEKKVQVDTRLVEVYENQRWNIITGFCDTGLPTDRYMWSDESGRVSLTKDSFQLPSSYWKWDSDWQIDYRDADDDGWSYAFDFPNSYHAQKYLNDYVRRRRWYRLMKVESISPWIPGPGTKLRSISICPGVAAGAQISVWVVTVDGNVLVRDRVSTDSPQGDSWIAVRNPIPFVQICVGPFCVWAVASDGTAYVRNGTKDKLDGLYWFQVEKPESGANIVEMSMGGSVVWAVCDDNQLYFRKNFSWAFPEGTEWQLVAEHVSKVSVSLSDQLYAIVMLSDDKSVVSRRTGVRYDNKIGTGWEHGIFAKHVSCRNLCDK